MNEETLWGVICIIWVGIATLPYLYATGLSMIGKDEASDHMIDRLGLPWVVGFIGLLGLWGLAAPAVTGAAYSCAVLILATGWIFWKNAKSKGAGKKVPRSVTTDQREQKESSTMLLSNSQRYILIAVSVLVGIVLIAQIEEEGLRDSPWMIGLLVIAALLLLAFAPRKK